MIHEHSEECIAIIVTASGQGSSTLQGAEIARVLTEAKIQAQQDILCSPRFKQAQKRLIKGMRVIFHQGGAPSRFENQVPNVGRLTAGGNVEF